MLTYDISGVQKPARLKAVVAKVERLIEVMASAGKPVQSVAINSSDYHAILSGVNKGRDGDEYGRLCVGSVEVRPA